MNKERGILLIALGHPNYGRMALNLATSLKYTSNLPIVLAYDNSAISQIQPYLNTFSDLIEIPQKAYHRKGGKEYIKAKTYIYNLSPFEETIYLDVDMLWLPKRPIDLIFEELKEVNLAIQSRGAVDLTQDQLPDKASFWCDLNEYKKAYGGEKFYSLSSEFIYFKKTKEIKKFFTDSIKAYDNLKVKHTVFSGGIPDELVFNVALLENGLSNYQDFYTPIYWEQAERKNLQPNEMYQKYYGYSAGGKQYSNIEKRFYDNLSKFYGTDSGVHYLLKDKYKFLPERANI